MKFKNKQNQIKKRKKLLIIISAICLVAATCVGIVYAASSDSTDDRKLQNGSFEEGQSWSNTYSQPDQSMVPYWNTTAFQGKIELFKKNTGVYVKDVTLTPTDGSYAAELNADEESTLYQNVKTSPSSIYEWGLDHGARNGTDTMALVIGPKQSVDPSKPSKSGRDQLMQMIDWLIDQGKTSVKTSAGLGEQLTVYSKKFAEKGTFQDNAGNNAFSLTPSTIYTEEWRIWIMADSRAVSGTNPWGSYGSNAEGAASGAAAGDVEVDFSKYYLYTVPAGQTETLFGFVSVGVNETTTTPDKEKTFGNFLDNINFQIYHPLSGSTTNHGSAVIGGSDGSSGGEGASEGHKVTVDNKLTTYVIDGETLKIQAVVNKNDAEAGCEFVGVYYTSQDKNGNPETVFLNKAGNEIDDTGSLTDDEKKGKWIKSTNDNGDTVYTYYLEGLNSATDLHFIFIKNPTITYDPNGGKAYTVERIYNTSEAENVYSFKPASGVPDTEAGTDGTFIAPYVSKAAEGQNDGWKFMGWLLTGDTVTDIPSGTKKVNAEQLGTMLLPAVHTVACDYMLNNASKQSAAQYFKIYTEQVHTNKVIDKDDNGMVNGVTWDAGDKEIAYANVHNGLTMVAQWRWRQAFIPQINSGADYINSSNGGTVEITSVTNESDVNYNDQYNLSGGKAYHAKTNETVMVKAKAKSGYEFIGWYDEGGNLVSTDAEYSYVETRESVNTYYARFKGSVTQTYIRQIRNGDSWENADDNIGVLDRYSYIDAVGMPISSTATAKSGYKFVGWYDSDGNKVTEDMLINNGTTISYTTTCDATYYARFEKTYTLKFVAQTKQPDGRFKTDNVGGKVSIASVTDIDNATATSKASANSGAKFLGWYDKNGNLLSSGAAFTTTIKPDTNGVTYYARFEIVYNPVVNSKVYLSFIAESENTQIPSVFNGRDAGTGINAKGYGIENKYGNTVSTGFKYSIDNMTNVSTVQITVKIPDSAYVKVGGTGTFMGDGNSILTDSTQVIHNRGSIQKISGATEISYYWNATGLKVNTDYGFIIDNLYAPGATATITVNGTGGIEVNNDNGVVNTAAADFDGKSHYPK